MVLVCIVIFKAIIALPSTRIHHELAILAPKSCAAHNDASSILNSQTTVFSQIEGLRRGVTKWGQNYRRVVLAENSAAALERCDIGHSIEHRSVPVVREPDSSRLPPASEALAALAKLVRMDASD